MLEVRKATYACFVSNIFLQKEETHHVRLTAGGNLIGYPGPVSTPTAKITTTKILLNRFFSTSGTTSMTRNIKDFYRNNPMPQYKCMRIAIAIIPQ